ncbi:hypothetical protein [Streptomyces sp. NPDC046832]|uniref:hypothetical protein n=1 Tax=Streptomyces sp. NPDC046832 TaxID=3155020 RepID=UPI0033C4C048
MAGLSAHGRGPLTWQHLERHAELASQPLLLTMLALYNAAGGALRRADDDFDVTELYELLLSSFARREVGKTTLHAVSDEDTAALVEQELKRLSFVAFAQLNPGRQWVSADELEQDLTAVLGRQPVRPPGFLTPLTAAETALGRFFFVQRAHDPLDALDRIEPLFHEAIGLHLYSQPHLTQVVEQERTLALDAIGVQGDERHEALDWLLRPRRLPLVLQGRLDWYEQVLCAPPDHTDQLLIDHLATWRYLTAGDSKQPTTEAELRARLTADRRCLDQTAEQARRLRKIADGDLPPVPTALHSAGAAHM